MNRIDPARGDEPDAWLAQALRHAPDGQADAPPALSDAILREARAAARPSASASRFEAGGALRWIRAAWGWLARPPVAAGFASLMVVTLAGVLWRDQPLDESLPRTPEAVLSTPNARAEAAAPPVINASPAPSEKQAPPAEPAAPKPAPSSLESAAQGRQAEKQDADKSTGTAHPADEPSRRRGTADAESAAAMAAPPPAALPAAPLARESAAPATQAAGASSTQANADTASPSRNAVRALQGNASPGLAKGRTAGAADAPLATLRARIAQQPERWRWQRQQGAAQPMNAAVQRWLAELDRQITTDWQSGSSSAAGSVRLFFDGALQTTLGLTDSAVWIEIRGESAPAALFAPLPEGAVDSLRKALDQATL